MAQLRAPLATVEGWRRKSGEYFNQSNDRIHSLHTKGFDAMVLLLSPSADPNQLRRALASFDSDRMLSEEFENSNAEPFRRVTHGFMESAHLTFIHLVNKIDTLQAIIDGRIQKSYVEQNTQTDKISLNENAIKTEEILNENMEHPLDSENVNEEVEVAEYPRPVADSLDRLSTVPNFSKSFPVKKEELMEPKEEPIEQKNEPIDTSERAEYPLPVIDSTDALSTIPNFTKSFLVKKEEPIEPKEEQVDTAETIPSDNQNSGLGSVRNEMDFMEEGMLNDDVDNRMYNMHIDNSLNEEPANSDIVNHSNRTDSSKTVEVEKRRRSLRGVNRTVMSNESMNDSDEPAVKKTKADSEMKDQMRSSRSINDQFQSASVEKLNKSELECPKCEYRTKTVSGWLNHLKRHHSTTQALAGLALLCDCGHESLSEQHSKKCTIGNVNIVRKRDGPIKRLDNSKTTPQCVLCEFYPKTATGYSQHLQRKHNSNLKKEEIYLICDCGLEVRSEQERIHLEECDRRQFSLHKLNEE